MRGQKAPTNVRAVDKREGHTRSTKSLGGVRISQEKPSQKLAPADLSADPP
jgi:hypothetical protein